MAQLGYVLNHLIRALVLVGFPGGCLYLAYLQPPYPYPTVFWWQGLAAATYHAAPISGAILWATVVYPMVLRRAAAPPPVEPLPTPPPITEYRVVEVPRRADLDDAKAAVLQRMERGLLSSSTGEPSDSA